MRDPSTLSDVITWAREAEEPRDAICALERVPARLGMLDSDLAALPADLESFERCVAGTGYALVSRARDIDAAGRRADARIRALLRRYHAQRSEAVMTSAARADYDALIAIVAANEGLPSTGARWNIGRHRSLYPLRARACCAPQDLTQSEIDRIGRAMSAGKRKNLRKAVQFLNKLASLTNEIPELRAYLPGTALAPPAMSSRLAAIDWPSLPAPFRASFDDAADACVAGPDELAERYLARIEAGEEPERVMADADKAAASNSRSVAKPDAARAGYKQAVSWVLRAWREAGGDLAQLSDIREIFGPEMLKTAICEHIARARNAHDMKDPITSGTLHTRLANLTTLARHGLRDKKAVARVALLRKQYYDTPRRKARNNDVGDMDADKLFDMLRQRPQLAAIWTNAPQRISAHARRELKEARKNGSTAREITALRRFAGAVAYAIQLSRPLRTACLRHMRIRSAGDAPANLVRDTPDGDRLQFRFQGWEVKNQRAVTVDVTGDDAHLVREWIATLRPRFIELRGIDDSPYLLPSSSHPARDSGDPVALPSGCYTTSSFLEFWEDASSVLGVHVTPHRLRHVVALLILASHPGNYALVATVLGNEEHTARRHYGRDNGEETARRARAAMLAQHRDLFGALKKRHAS